MKGLGGPYYECEYMSAEEFRELVYYKKGNTVWGTPLEVRIQENSATIGVEIFPNPANDILTLRIKDQLLHPVFEICDMPGKSLFSSVINSPESLLDVSQLKSGIYLYRLRADNRLVKIGKLIIK
jgi:hypothetical protein